MINHECERKYLLASVPDRLTDPVKIKQGYLREHITVRAANTTYHQHYTVSVSFFNNMVTGVFEYALPEEDAMFLMLNPPSTVRARVCKEVAGTKTAYLTMKCKSKGLAKPEFEYPISVAHAEFMIANMCGNDVIHKTRYLAYHEFQKFEVDVFRKALKGLVYAELELPSEDTPVIAPDWLGEEVTNDSEYSNKRLATAQRFPAHYYNAVQNGTCITSLEA